MPSSKSFFKHIYVEDSILEHENTKLIISKIKNPVIINIKNYLEIFGRKKQDFLLQKENPSLILAKKYNNFIYPNPPYCQNFGYKNSYYISMVLNCLFDCKYCFLQGMYDSGHLVIFVNIEDYVNELAKIKPPAMVFLSYDTDLLAIENLTGFIHKIYNFSDRLKGIVLEIRTKSSNFKVIEDLKSLSNIVLAWSLLPDELIKIFEAKTPPLIERLKAICKALEKGWKVRLCFDPLIFLKDSLTYYEKMINTICQHIDVNKVFDISLGNFRMNKDYLKKAKSLRPELLAIETEDKIFYNEILNKIRSLSVDKKINSLYN